MPVYEDARNGVWRYRKRITLPDGSKVRISGTSAIATREHALKAELDHIERAIESAREEAEVIRRIERADGPRFQAYGTKNGQKFYVGTAESESGARDLLNTFNRNKQQPSGSVASLRVIAVYENGVERELSPFRVDDADLLGFEAADDDYVAFVVRHPRRASADRPAVTADGEVLF